MYTLGMSKHRKSGRSINCTHFTGKKSSNPKRKQKLTSKQKRKKRGTHIDKYVNLKERE